MESYLSALSKEEHTTLHLSALYEKSGYKKYRNTRFEEYSFYHVDEVLVDLYLQEDSLTKDMVKYYDANLRIMEECKDIWRRYPKAEAKRWYIIGCLANKLGIKDINAFKYSFEKDKKMKTFVKLVLSKMKNMFNAS